MMVRWNVAMPQELNVAVYVVQYYPYADVYDLGIPSREGSRECVQPAVDG